MKLIFDSLDALRTELRDRKVEVVRVSPAITSEPLRATAGLPRLTSRVIVTAAIVEHVLTGRLRGVRFAIYIWLHLQADYTTGTVWTNAAKLASETGFYPSTVREALAGLRRDGYLGYESAEGERRLYEIRIEKYH